MDRNDVNWKGYIPAITTPFTADGRFDRTAWQELCEWMVAERMHGIIVGGTTGEWFSMSTAERTEQFRLAAEQVRRRITVIGGCNAFTPQEAVELARGAKAAGLDGILLTPPPYVVPSPREIVHFYETVARAVPIPIMVYNWPRGTNVDMTPETVRRLAEIDTVVALKNSTGDFGRFVESLVAVKDQLRVFGFPFNDVGIHLLQGIGGDGTAGSGAVLGHEQPDFYNYLWAGDLENARRVGERDRALFRAWIRPDFSAPFGSPQAIMKAALNLRGLPGGYPRPPILPLTPAEHESVRQVLVDLGLVGAA